MADQLMGELRNQIRGVTGALLVLGLTFHYTMETWWLGWTLPLPYLVGFALAGLAVVVALARVIGFRRGDKDRSGESEPWWSVGFDFAEILLQSFVASYAILLLVGILDFSSSPNVAMRLGLVEVVPLGFGAALANRLFGGEDGGSREGEFPENVPIFAVGAVFVATTIAPTQEMELIAAHMDWPRYPLLIALTLVLIYLVLFELEFKGQNARTSGSRHVQAGTAFIAYLVGTVVSFLLLLGFGHFVDATLALVYQETVVLAFPASLGAAAAEVII
ncbi:DUF2391 family protein [Halosimplex sp. J119]